MVIRWVETKQETDAELDWLSRNINLNVISSVISLRYLDSPIISLCIFRDQDLLYNMEHGCTESHCLTLQQLQHCSKLSMARLWRTFLFLPAVKFWHFDRGSPRHERFRPDRVAPGVWGGLDQSEASIQVTWSAPTNQRPESDWHSLSRGLKGIPHSSRSPRFCSL